MSININETNLSKINIDDLDIDSTFDSILAGITEATSTVSTAVQNFFDDTMDNISDLTNYLKDESYDILTSATSIWNNVSTQTALIASDAMEIAQTVCSGIYSTASNNYTDVVSSKELTSSVTDTAEAYLDTLTSTANTYISDAMSSIESYVGSVVTGTGSLATAINGAVSALADGLKDYEDGVSETTFGSLMEASWEGNGSSSFLTSMASANNTYTVNILNSTPLDSGETRSNLYGTMILGTPFLFNNMSDPNNRVLTNTLIKDGRYLSLTPGMPKYYGGSYTQTKTDSIYYQTTTPDEMLSYLLRNGLDKSFANNDKRYYTFEAKYKEYFAYLEAMLNPIWIKLGLASSTGSNTFNLFSFFDIKKSSNTTDDKIDAMKYDTLKSQYKSSIGYYLNTSSSVSESVSNQTTSFGSELSARTNSASEAYQKLSFITGMGTGGSTMESRRKIGVGINEASQLKSYYTENFTTAQSYYSTVKGATGSALLGIAASAAGALIDTTRLSATEDFSSLIQSFATTNGMKVIYPELWNDSSYSKNINFNFVFTSPYGDPLSIFKYVYVPFCSLLAFALPRQAAENGYVSPFFVRADVPGLITSDLALISDITWVKGGDANLWTKDGLPRSISCTLTLTDLYPYLSMTKRYSFLSANPSYTVFLDNMAGLCSLNQDNSDDPLNDYWNQMINRVSGESNQTVTDGLWNNWSSNKKKETKKYANGTYKTKKFTDNVNLNTTPWLNKV